MQDNIKNPAFLADYVACIADVGVNASIVDVGVFTAQIEITPGRHAGCSS